MADCVENIQWLTSDDATAHLDQAFNCPDPLVLAKKLRKSLSPDRVRLVLEQADLRRRARAKFTDADLLFFTRRGLEQASDTLVARYKANRLSRFSRVADLCCGIGGDLIEIARLTSVVGVDLDETTCALADANCQQLELSFATVRRDDARQVDVREYDAWHIDPDRRPGGVRTVSLQGMTPNSHAIRAALRQNPNGAIKLAPACRLEEDWLREAELQWIGHGQSVQQLVAWFGKLTGMPGCRIATVICKGRKMSSLLGTEFPPFELAPRIKQFVFEPHPAVLAAGLASDLAMIYQLEAIIPQGGYLTSDKSIKTPLLSTFRVVDVVPFREKSLRSLLTSLSVGEVELKQRGVKIDMNLWRKKLSGRGSQRLSVLVTRRQRAMIAIVAERLFTTVNTDDS
jgi:hypothetical protein